MAAASHGAPALASQLQDDGSASGDSFLESLHVPPLVLGVGVLVVALCAAALCCYCRRRRGRPPRSRAAPPPRGAPENTDFIQNDTHSPTGV